MSSVVIRFIEAWARKFVFCAYDVQKKINLGPAILVIPDLGEFILEPDFFVCKNELKLMGINASCGYAIKFHHLLTYHQLIGAFIRFKYLPDNIYNLPIQHVDRFLRKHSSSISTEFLASYNEEEFGKSRFIFFDSELKFYETTNSYVTFEGAVMSNGILVKDSLHLLRSGMQKSISFDDKNHFVVLCPEPNKRLDLAINLIAPGSSNFFHFLIDFVLKILILKKIGINKKVKFIAVKAVLPFQVELLEYFGIEEEWIVFKQGDAFFVDKLLTIGPLYTSDKFSKSALSCFPEMINKDMNNVNRILYLSRKRTIRRNRLYSAFS